MKTHYNYLAAILPMVGFYLLCCFDGNLFSPDSEYYLYFAKKLWFQGELTDLEGNQMVHWPPLFICLAIPFFYFTGYFFWTNLILMIIHQLIWVKIGEYYLEQSRHSLFFYFLLGLNVLVFQVFIYVWSEPLFMTLLAIAIWHMHRYYASKKLKDLILFAMSLYFCLLTRNAGVFLLPGLLISGLVVFKGKERWKWIGALALATSGLACWSFYLWLTADFSSAVVGVVPEWTIIDNISLTFSELGYNFIPRLIPDWFTATVMLITFGLALLKSIKTPLTWLIIPALVSYLLFWMVIPAQADDMGRFLAPLMPPFLLVIVQSMGAFLKNPKLKLIFYGISYYLIVFSLLRIIRNTITWSNII